MEPEVIIIHHSLTKDSLTASWPAIRKYHKNLGWADIGYHFGIEDINGGYEILTGRFPNVTGAHCRGFNKKSIGICMVGNFDIDPPPAKQVKVLIKLIAYLMKTYSITVLLGHCELNLLKSCPGKMFDMDKLRDDVLKELS